MSMTTDVTKRQRSRTRSAIVLLIAGLLLFLDAHYLDTDSEPFPCESTQPDAVATDVQCLDS